MALAVAAALGVQLVRSSYRSHRPRRNAARARKLGKNGERRARELLRRAGFDIHEPQPSRAYTMAVGGRPRTVQVRPDFLVRQQQSGRLMVAEAKAGDVASRPDQRATRRQLMEYAHAFAECTGVLLVDTDRGQITEVEFPAVGTEPSRGTRRWPTSFAWGVLVGGLASATLFALAAIAMMQSETMRSEALRVYERLLECAEPLW